MLGRAWLRSDRRPPMLSASLLADPGCCSSLQAVQGAESDAGLAEAGAAQPQAQQQAAPVLVMDLGGLDFELPE